MKRPLLTADTLECPYCQGDDVTIKQQGHFVNTLMLICFPCQRAANFTGPEVIFTPELRRLPVRTDFRPEPEF